MSVGIIDPAGIAPKVRSGEMRAMRQSLFGSYEICPRRAQLSLGDKEYRSGDARCLGTGYHAGHEIYWLKRMLGLEWTMEESIEAIRQAIMDDVEKSVHFGWTKFSNPSQLIDIAEACFRDYMAHHVHHWDEWQVLGVETQMYVPWSDTWALSGSVDLVLGNGAKTILIDHKTAGRAWDGKKHLKSPQAPMYTWLWTKAAELSGVDPGVVSFAWEIVTHKLKFDRRHRVVTPGQLRLMEERATQACLDLQRGIDDDAELFANPSSNLCSPVYCDHIEHCMTGKIANAMLETTSVPT